MQIKYDYYEAWFILFQANNPNSGITENIDIEIPNDST